MSLFNLIKLDATPSTNDYLKIRHKTGIASDGDLVWAQHQTSGRGQRDKHWESAFENSLTFSIYRTFDDFKSVHPFLISLMVSMAIIETLEELGIPKLAIKWPNDILSCNQKIGGILIENFFSKGRLNASVIGIGINLNQDDFNNIPNAASLKQLTGKHWSPQQLLNRLLPYLHANLHETENWSHQNMLASYNQKLWRRNQSSVFEASSERFRANLLGVSAHGKLILEKSDKEVTEQGRDQIRMLYDIN